MFTLMDSKRDHNCEGFSRREFLRIGGLGLGGLGLGQMTLSNLMAAEASGNLKKAVRGKSVVLLFLHGGPPHIECFDPKMTAPAEIRSITGEVKTKISGVTFGGTFPKMAAIADKLAVVRSYASGNAGHTYNSVASGGNPLKAAMGSIYSRVVGSNNRSTGMPTNAIIKPEAVKEGLKLGNNFESQALPTVVDPGSLGPMYGAFDPSGGGPLKKDMSLTIDPKRLTDRRNLLSGLDRLKRKYEKTDVFKGPDKFQQQAFDVITRGVADAFDLSKEDPKTIKKYDTSGLFRLEDVTRWFDMRRASNQLGKQMLLARRLCEAGCGFVTVSDCGWDFHSNNNSPKNLGGMRWLGPQADHAVAAFVEDIHQRGLSDDILLVVTGEMGRTPRINKNGGREHYSALTSLVFAGAGVKGGKVIGKSDSHATKPATKAYGPKNLLGTIMHTLFDPGELRVARGIPKDVSDVITDSKPIDGVL